MKRIISIVLATLMAASMLPGFAVAENKLWTEVEMPDGWTKIINEGGATLGYTKGTGLNIIEADGYAFKDLDRDGKLDVFEDWRVGYEERAQALVDSGLLTLEFQMGMKMNPGGSGGKANANELSDDIKAKLDLGYRHLRHPSATSSDAIVGWNNLIQAYIEADDSVVCIPSTFIADPLGGKNVSDWPGYLGIAASFDPELAAEYGQRLSKEWRALGISMKVAPQMDLATEPRWNRIDMTFGEDPQLSMDMAVAMVNAWQSTYDEEGNDLGWGEDSVNCQIKHLTGDGAAEAGRESHTADGAFNVFPGGQFYTHMLPFVACLHLPGKTEAVSAAMTNYSIALDENGDPIGDEMVGTSFNDYKINELWRGEYGFNGYILTDFGVTGGAMEPKTYHGVADMTRAERMLEQLVAGCDSFGGCGGELQADVDLAMEAYNLGVEKLGQEKMDQIMAETTTNVLKVLFNVGVVDNPYLDSQKAKKTADSAENNTAGFEAQVKSVVMLKNHDGLIKEAGDEKLTVYIPWQYTPEKTVKKQMSYVTVAASFAPTVDLQTALKYFNVVTDKLGQPSGPAGEDGKATYLPEDIIRASAEDIAKCDFALVRISSPQNGNPTADYTDEGTMPADYEYLPISLQYRSYTADSMYVRLDSIGGLITSKEVQGTYGMETVYEKENRSYYGKTAIINNEEDLDLVLYAASAADKVVVAVDAMGAMIFNEFESEVDSILVGWSGGRAPAITDAAFFEIIAGKKEPSGLLPLQMPANMDTVEAQYEDVPRDMECHVDADGNTYDFAFGMNWSGVIDDERVAKYSVEPISVDETSVLDYFVK